MTSTPNLITHAVLTAVVAGSTLLGGCGESISPIAQTTTAPCDVASPTARVLRRPVLRLSENGAWGTAAHSAGIPTFSLYEDGLVIYADGDGETARAMQARLTPQEVYALVDLAHEKLGDMPANIEVTQATDQPRATIGVGHGGRIYSVGVYGFGEEGTPEAFRELHRTLNDFSHPEAEPWQPDELEVVVFRKDDQVDSAKAWPGVLPLPPADAREPRPRVLGRKGTEIQQPIRYRVDGALEPQLAEALPPAGTMQAFSWRGTAWLIRTERVVPARTYFW